MPILSTSLTLLVASEHFYFLWLEMFAWETKGPKVFRNFHKDLFPKTTVMAANQGLYNGFLAVGLVWSLFVDDELWSSRIASYFFSCVSVAGLYGWYSVSKRIFYVQGIPAILGLAAVQFSI